MNFGFSTKNKGAKTIFGEKKRKKKRKELTKAKMKEERKAEAKDLEGNNEADGSTLGHPRGPKQGGGGGNLWKQQQFCF